MQGTARFGGSKHISFSKSNEHLVDSDYPEMDFNGVENKTTSLFLEQESLSKLDYNQISGGLVVFTSSEQIKLKEEASRLEETLLYEGNEDSLLNRSSLLHNAVKRVTDPLMLSDLMKTSSPPMRDRAVNSNRKDSKDQKENRENFSIGSKKALFHPCEIGKVSSSVRPKAEVNY